MQCVLNPGFWVYLICLIGMIMIIRLVFPQIISFFGFPAVVAQALMIILWVIIACAGVYFIFELFGCLFSGGGLSLPRIPR